MQTIVHRSFDLRSTPFRETKMSQQEHGILHDVLKRSVAVLQKLNIEYALAYGSLLGAVRYGNRMPWDDDVDLIVFNATPFTEAAYKQFEAEHIGVLPFYYGFALYDLDHYRIVDGAPYPCIDIITMENDRETHWQLATEAARQAWPDEHAEFDTAVLFPLSTIVYDGMQLTAPHHISEYLTSLYGTTWAHEALIRENHAMTHEFPFIYKLLITPKTTQQILHYLDKMTNKENQNRITSLTYSNKSPP